MKMFNKLIIITTVFCGTFLFGATSSSTTPETQFTNGVNTRTDCRVECPPMKTGYFSRIIDFVYETGATTCYVYDLQNPTKAIAKVVNENQYCKNALINPTAVASINSNSGAVQSHLTSLESRYKSYFTTTAGASYLSLPKYMVAGLMADDDIINIPTSITTNEVTLKSGYTVFPNISGATNYGDEALISRTKDALSNSVTFVINFLSKSNNILMSFQVALFMFTVAMSLGLLLTQKGTKKASQIQDHEDFAEKILFGVVSILVFFLPLNKIATPTGDISQNGYQQLIRPLIYLGVETADKLAETATSSVLRYKFDAVGLGAEQDLQNLQNLLFAELKKKAYNDSMAIKCSQVYNTAELKTYTKLLATNLSYPPSEEIFTKGFGSDEKRAVTFYTKKYMTSESLVTSSDVPAVSFCSKVERDILQSKSFINNLTQKIANYQTAVSSEMDKKIKIMTDMTYRNVSELGFVSIVNLGTTLMAFDNFSLLGQNKNVQENYESTMEDYRDATGYEIQGFAKPSEDEGITAILNSATNEVLTNAPYYIFTPFGSTLQSYVNSVFNPVKEKVKENAQLGNILLNWIPVVGDTLGQATQFAISKGASFAIDTANGMLTIYLLKEIINILPLVAIISSGFLVIAFYFLSISILYIVIPFASIFAFSTGNLEIIKNLVKQTFILAVKPVLIVVSVLMALLVADLIISLNKVVITSMFEPLFALTINASNTSTSIFSSVQNFGFGGIFLFLKSTMLLASNFVTIFVCFYLVFNGANIILDILGMKDGGFDVGGIIGDKVEGKHSVSKMNTVV